MPRPKEDEAKTKRVEPVMIVVLVIIWIGLLRLQPEPKKINYKNQTKRIKTKSKRVKLTKNREIIMPKNKNDIKYTSKLPSPIKRNRDGEIMTRYLTIKLTEEEAISISECFQKNYKENKITTSLIRGFLIFESLNKVDPDFLIEQMAKLKVKTELSKNLAYEDYIVAMSLLKSHKEKKLAPKPEKVQAKSVTKNDTRRMYVPEIIVKKKG